MKNPATRIAAWVVLMFATHACAVVDAKLSPDFSNNIPTTIEILTPESEVSDGTEILADAIEAGLLARGFEVTRAVKADPSVAPSQAAADSHADAVLSARILQWDYRARVQSTDFAVAASFRLVGADGRELWRVDEHMETSSYDGLTQSIVPEEEFERLAARLVDRVFDTLPSRLPVQ